MRPLVGLPLSQNHWQGRFSSSTTMGGTAWRSASVAVDTCFAFAGSFCARARGAVLASMTPRARERRFIVLDFMARIPWDYSGPAQTMWGHRRRVNVYVERPDKGPEGPWSSRNHTIRAVLWQSSAARKERARGQTHRRKGKGASGKRRPAAPAVRMRT